MSHYLCNAMTPYSEVHKDGSELVYVVVDVTLHGVTCS